MGKYVELAFHNIGILFTLSVVLMVLFFLLIVIIMKISGRYKKPQMNFAKKDDPVEIEKKLRYWKTKELKSLIYKKSKSNKPKDKDTRLDAILTSAELDFLIQELSNK